MEIKLRQEKQVDHSAVAEAIIASYKDVGYSNHREQLMVERLRNSDSFVPELSIVAENEHQEIVGHIMLTKMHIQNKGIDYSALTLAPLSIIPSYQNKGIGSKLVMESHRIAADLGFKFIAILGIPNYYPKFGYELTSRYDISLPIKIAKSNSLIISLIDHDFSEIIGGTIKYSDEFFEKDQMETS
ncbi:GNAT family N-acetyltransferase [Pedobacter sp. L105]|uniref:GNAT family N-acetyltransferase n=1 Tax=Pedobacter sp. L105 TaxID=1641871 RepID=UPI00131BE5E8|nr:N-acetyltransferase [Pedobacter sp. L105]